VLAESPDISDMVQAVTRFAAGRLVERERAHADDSNLSLRYAHVAQKERRKRAWQRVRMVLFSVFVGIAAFFAAAWFIAKP
jgi:hypothetical protein